MHRGFAIDPAVVNAHLRNIYSLSSANISGEDIARPLAKRDQLQHRVATPIRFVMSCMQRHSFNNLCGAEAAAIGSGSQAMIIKPFISMHCAKGRPREASSAVLAHTEPG